MAPTTNHHGRGTSVDYYNNNNKERDGLIDWKPLEAEVKFLAGKVKLLQANFGYAALFFKEVVDAVDVSRRKTNAMQIHAPTHFSKK